VSSVGVDGSCVAISLRPQRRQHTVRSIIRDGADAVSVGDRVLLTDGRIGCVREIQGHDVVVTVDEPSKDVVFIGQTAGG
jgi:preprotein translocase subunit YajC